MHKEQSADDMQSVVLNEQEDDQVGGDCLLFKCQTMKSYLNWIQCFPTPRSGAGVIFQFHSISSQMTYNNVRMFAQISMTAM